MSGKIYHPESKHPQPYQEDLNPDANVGQNHGQIPAEGKDSGRSAHDLKKVHQRLQDYQDDELRRIPVLPEGVRLEQGATYLDLNAPEPAEFTARGDQETGPDQWLVPKARVDYPLWNRLLGRTEPERTQGP